MTEAPQTPDHGDDLVGRVIADRYRVDARLGEGGMGTVYRVEHTHMRKRLALKVLHRDLTSHAEVVARFEREAMAAANIEHPNVANATDFGKLPDGSFYLVLEYVEGTDLRQILQDERFLSPARAVHVTLQILGALGRAHDLGIVHRDLKPENILLLEKDGDPEFVKILDFGIARVPVGALGTPSRSAGEAKPLTKAGTVYGTPEYMAPEQALGHQVDGRADLYAVGILLFEMLTGVRPFDDKDKIALLGAHVSKAPPAVRDRAPKEQLVPEGLEAVVAQLLAKSPDDRYPAARDVAAALFDLGFEAPMPITRHPSQRGGDRSGAHRMPESSPSQGKIKIVPGPTADVPVRLEVEGARPVGHEAGERTVEAKAAEPPRPRGSKLPWVIAIVSALVAITAVALLRRETAAGSAAPSAAGGATATAAVAPTAASGAPSAATSADAKSDALRALGRITSGEIDEGLKELQALVAANPTDPVILRTLAQGYAKAKRLVDALDAVKTLVAASPDAASDPHVWSIVEEALVDAKVEGKAVDVALGTMGAAGARALYAYAFSDAATAVTRGRAIRALRDPKRASVVPAGLRAALDLRLAGTCPARKLVLEKRRKDLDADALPILQSMTKPTCGPDKKRDCWPCIKDLDAIVKEVESKG